MTDAERDRLYRQAQSAILRQRAGLLRDTLADILALLKRAQQEIKLALVDAPSDYKAWYLPQLQGEIDRVMAQLGGQSAVVLSGAADDAWAMGQLFVVEPLAAGGLSLVGKVPHLDLRQLTAMKSFMADRIKDVSATAASAIKSELGMVVIGAKPVSEAISRTLGILGGASRTRATTIVRTEVSRVFGVAANERIQQAAAAGVEMDKVWRRSGKLHPRLSHALADGQRVAYDQPFVVGGVQIMFPHDPTAPASHTINCGCVMIPRPRGWKTSKPDHKPFTEDELRRNPKLREIVESRAEGGPSMRELSAGAGVTAATAGKKAAGAILDSATNAYAVAKAGGRHSGLLKQLKNYGQPQLRKALRSYQEGIDLHRAKLANPELYCDNWAGRSPEYRAGLLRHWQLEIDDARDQIAVIEGYRNERK